MKPTGALQEDILRREDGESARVNIQLYVNGEQERRDMVAVRC